MEMNNPLGLDELFDALDFSNPHTLFVSHEGELLKIGSGFKKSIDFGNSLNFNDVFKWVSGGSFEKIKAQGKVLLFIETIDGLKRYKISGKVSDWGYILHGSPVINLSLIHI